MKKQTNHRASVKAARNLTIKTGKNGHDQAGLRQFVPETCRPEICNNPPKNLKTVIEYSFQGIRNTANTLYWGGRWPDDFFLGNRFTAETPRKTDIADVMEWMATVDDLAIFHGVDVSGAGGEVPHSVLYRALSLELRLHTEPAKQL